MSNVIEIRTRNDANQMDMAHLEEVLLDLTSGGTPVAMVVCTMGTTDANAFDPIAEVRALLDRYPNPEGFGKAVLYADAVVGWPWVCFQDYDFGGNPLEFSSRILPMIQKNSDALRGLCHADAVGIDFHKLGWSPYVSSCFLYKNAAEFESLLRRGEDAYLQPRTPYNPLYYTFEASRSAAGSLAGWATLKYLGKEGIQAILGGILEAKLYFSDLLSGRPDIVCVNPENAGLVTLFRIYPPDIEAEIQFEQELNEPASRDALLRHNALTEAVGDKLYEWFRTGKRIDGKCTPYLSFTKGFRNTAYNRDGEDTNAVIYALKSYFTNVFVTLDVMDWLLHCIGLARDEVLGIHAG